MNKDLYSEILKALVLAAEKFPAGNGDVSEEIKEDFETIIDECDISRWRVNVDGCTKGVGNILSDLDVSIKEGDRQKCVESIAMLRCAIADIASAFSNAMDSMEGLVVTIRDEKE
ncbi:hypothetical protein [uncultured Marinobacter sp.]|uniref:hypothetical protein n=1 Tax=uncultured Marinobacter sp. TaxID=187379 RepID=UPI00261E2DD0|nr:hypothetical protein [uncultured Marinobacter sp.]